MVSRVALTVLGATPVAATVASRFSTIPRGHLDRGTVPKRGHDESGGDTATASMTHSRLGKQ